jgi:hypothetical protein
LPDLFIVRVFDLGGSTVRDMTLAISIDPGHVSAKEHHLPIAKITSQVSQSRSAADTAPSIWKVLERVLYLSSSRTVHSETSVTRNARPVDAYAQ